MTPHHSYLATFRHQVAKLLHTNTLFEPFIGTGWCGVEKNQSTYHLLHTMPAPLAPIVCRQPLPCLHISFTISLGHAHLWRHVCTSHHPSLSLSLSHVCCNRYHIYHPMQPCKPPQHVSIHIRHLSHTHEYLHTSAHKGRLYVNFSHI